MERHFDGAELGGVVSEVDKLFAQRFDALGEFLGNWESRLAGLAVGMAVVMVVVESPVTLH